MNELRAIADKLRDGQWDLNRVLADQDVPDLVGHTLACDCAQFFLEGEQEAGRIVDRRSWEALRIKRLWIEGLVDEEGCQQAYELAKEAAWECWLAWDALRGQSNVRKARSSKQKTDALSRELADAHASWEAARITKDAVHLSLSGALWAVRHVSPLWQTQRLIWLCDIWGICGDRTPFLLREGELPLPEPEQASLSHSIAFAPDT